VVFRDVEVYADELIGPDSPSAEPRPFATLNTPILQHVFVNLYLGIALGALEEARAYTLTTMRLWLTSGAQAARLDTYIIEQYGVFWSELSAAVALAEAVGGPVQQAYDRGDSPHCARAGRAGGGSCNRQGGIHAGRPIGHQRDVRGDGGARHKRGTGIRPLLA